MEINLRTIKPIHANATSIYANAILVHVDGMCLSGHGGVYPDEGGFGHTPYGMGKENGIHTNIGKILTIF
jgi:hypothetical protein